MVAMRVFSLVLGIFFILLGLIFMIAAADTNFIPRFAVGTSMVLLGGYLLRRGIKEPADKTVVISRTLELSGDVNLEDLKCNQCGASLSSDSISLKAGTVFVSCPYCSSEYQIEEKPKW
jgi:DNA-directed RNA polymerase subunit RPC12/RpoP